MLDCMARPLIVALVSFQWPPFGAREKRLTRSCISGEYRNHRVGFVATLVWQMSLLLFEAGTGSGHCWVNLRVYFAVSWQTVRGMNIYSLLIYFQQSTPD
jgi:hypothetical protein